MDLKGDPRKERLGQVLGPGGAVRFLAAKNGGHRFPKLNKQGAGPKRTVWLKQKDKIIVNTLTMLKESTTSSRKIKGVHKQAVIYRCSWPQVKSLSE